MSQQPLKVCLTHDIDRLHKTYQYLTHDVCKGRIRGLRTLFNGSRPYWQLDTLADLEARYDVRSTVFFLHESIAFRPFRISSWKLSLGRYSLYDPQVIHAIRNLHAGGWEIGLHGSYESFKSPHLLKTEKMILEEALGHHVQGVRQHYLNHIEPDTWNYQKEAGFRYDASLGRTNGIGYSDNRIRPFHHRQSGMFVIPLTIMDSCLFKESGGNRQKALRMAVKWMDHAQKNNCPFTILWHQRMFNEEDFPGYRWVYEEIIKEAKVRNAEFVTCHELQKRHKSMEIADD